jgi:hypothetical protein
MGDLRVKIETIETFDEKIVGAILKGMKDFERYRVLVLPDHPTPLSVRTDKYPPLAKFSARFGILEWKADPVLPVTLRNLEPEVKARTMKVDQEQGLLGKVTGKVLNVPPEKGAEVQAWLRKAAAASRETSMLVKEKEPTDCQPKRSPARVASGSRGREFLRSPLPPLPG